jgi:hypothetical protein
VSGWLAVLLSRVRILDLNGHHIAVGILETAELPPPVDTLPGVQASAVELSFRGPAASVNGADNYMKISAHARDEQLSTRACKWPSSRSDSLLLMSVAVGVLMGAALALPV